MSAAKNLSELLSAYFCGKCGYLGSEGPDHPGCGYSAFRDRRYHMAVDLEKRLDAVTEALKRLTDTVESRFEGLEIVALVPQDLARDVKRAREALAKVKP